MFAIILAIIAIALTILASVVTLMYLDQDGGSSAKAQAAKILNEASQIRGAILIARNDGLYMDTQTSLEVLKPKYLADIPSGMANWGLGENRVYKTDVNDAVCLAANISLGHKFTKADTQVRAADGIEDAFIPLCEKSDLNPNVPCCDNSSAVVAP